MAYYSWLILVAFTNRKVGPDPEEEVIRARLRGWPWVSWIIWRYYHAITPFRTNQTSILLEIHASNLEMMEDWVTA